MQFPDNVKYTKDHEWLQIDGASATMGITEFAQKELGEIVFVDLPALGKSVKAGDTLCVVESTKAASDVYSPVSGKVKEVNTKLSGAPELVNSSSYTDGWMVKLEGINAAEAGALMTAAQYKEFLGDKV